MKRLPFFVCMFFFCSQSFSENKNSERNSPSDGLAERQISTESQENYERANKNLLQRLNKLVQDEAKGVGDARDAAQRAELFSKLGSIYRKNSEREDYCPPCNGGSESCLKRQAECKRELRETTGEIETLLAKGLPSSSREASSSKGLSTENDKGLSAEIRAAISKCYKTLAPSIYSTPYDRSCPCGVGTRYGRSYLIRVSGDKPLSFRGIPLDESERERCGYPEDGELEL